ncbi:CAP domain-containing protein [Georgenia wutianyii]|uniref:CAP domain-containing protein n=1 Tax=Georgenia wutianyii TaxID=2585135 RepID=A0ABX5VN39_9MICO|nr:CAP domain-containing protein [Georgenia wutianyii]QDB79932.1 CAP domain-containing protein [Georgenia wutianyii]
MMGRSVGALRLAGCLGVVAAALGACGAGAAHPEPAAPPGATPEDPSGYAAELVELTNETRYAEGLQPLAASDCARQAAVARATDLVGQEELVHAPLGPVIQECAPFTTAAENLVNSTAEPADVVAAWLDSSGHRANLLDPALTEIGIGCVPDGARLLCSQLFLGP